MQKQETNALKKRLSTKVLVKAGFLATVSIVLTRFFSLMIPLGGLPALRVGFGSIPLIMAGMMFGPVVGGITGIVADVVGYMINPMGGTFFPGFTLTAALYGIISGLLFKNFRIQNLKLNFNFVNAVIMLAFGAGILKLLFDNGITSWLIVLLVVLVTALFVALPFAIGSRYKNKEQKIGFDKIAFAVNLTYVINALFLNTLWLAIMFDAGFIGFLPGRVIAAAITIPVYTLVIFTLGKFINLLEQ